MTVRHSLGGPFASGRGALSSRCTLESLLPSFAIDSLPPTATACLSPARSPDPHAGFVNRRSLVRIGARQPLADLQTLMLGDGWSSRGSQPRIPSNTPDLGYTLCDWWIELASWRSLHALRHPSRSCARSAWSGSTFEAPRSSAHELSRGCIGIMTGPFDRAR